MQHILAVGADIFLLYTRSLVLGRSGCTVKTATPEQSLLMLDNGNFDLLVLCHSLNENDVHRVCRHARDASRSTKILLIESGNVGLMASAQVDCRFLLEDGPHLLVKVVRELLVGSTPEECVSLEVARKPALFAAVPSFPARLPRSRGALSRYHGTRLHLSKAGREG